MANETVAETLVRPREHRENRKKNRGRKVEDNQAMAVAKFLRVPPRKARLVIDEVRGKYVEDALAFLRFIPNRAAGYIAKVLTSAAANAVNNHDLDANSLKLIEARVDEGPRMKRVQPRAQGRAYRILKRTSHITIIVEEVEPKPRRPKKKTGGKAEAARRARQGQQAAPTPAPAALVVAEEETTPATAEETVVEETPAVTEADSAPLDATAPEIPPSDTADEIGAPTESDAENE